VAALTDSPNPQVYWRVMKKRLSDEGNQTVTNCNAFKMQAADGKMRLTDCASTEQLFRLIQSIPSPKAEPFKQWMAMVASERLDQMQDPELSIEQAMTDYKRLGYSDNWINQRLKSFEIKRPHRRMEKTRLAGGRIFRRLDRHHLSDLGGQDGEGV